MLRPFAIDRAEAIFLFIGFVMIGFIFGSAL
jgi:hypothetical protein